MAVPWDGGSRGAKGDESFARPESGARAPWWARRLRPVGCVRGCLKSPEMSVFDRCRATSEGVPIALSPLKSMMPIFTWTPFHAATKTHGGQEPIAGDQAPRVVCSVLAL